MGTEEGAKRVLSVMSKLVDLYKSDEHQQSLSAAAAFLRSVKVLEETVFHHLSVLLEIEDAHGFGWEMFGITDKVKSPTNLRWWITAFRGLQELKRESGREHEDMLYIEQMCEYPFRPEVCLAHLIFQLKEDLEEVLEKKLDL